MKKWLDTKEQLIKQYEDRRKPSERIIIELLCDIRDLLNDNK